MAANQSRIAITGAFSYSGRYIAEKLLGQGHEVLTLTGSPERPNPFDGKIKAYPFNFSQPEKLVETLRGVETLINTYWVRFDHGDKTYKKAVENTQMLFKAAVQAGVRRVVHVSITNPDRQSPLPYFSGKGVLEEDLMGSGVSYAILRPTVIFGKEDILINNMAWFLRRFPVFTIPGNGEYRLQPIYVGDLAELAAGQATSAENVIVDAVGPETFTFNELIELLRETVNSKALILHTSPRLARSLSAIVGKLVGDVVLTREEVEGLMANLLFTDSAPAGETKLSDWVHEHASTLGRQYANELSRHYRKA